MAERPLARQWGQSKGFTLCAQPTKRSVRHPAAPLLRQDFDTSNGFSYLGNMPTFTANIGDCVRGRGDQL